LDLPIPRHGILNPHGRLFLCLGHLFLLHNQSRLEEAEMGSWEEFSAILYGLGCDKWITIGTMKPLLKNRIKKLQGLLDSPRFLLREK
jgi:hypothetical protein